ncbi:hypothetical protein STIAU_3848 [Stigmatella aurantiaca DW4/3-1]|uniref:Uncharacterized protein n=1 Tax=Stigmatella aurantiaca (strain DW4/3-1) TaxID=378806 RepID=Q090T4_STIAD|nr:hypothetical protein STIAU_3848 [Stigmatella aurantiaca DW4/3-1]
MAADARGDRGLIGHHHALDLSRIQALGKIRVGPGAVRVLVLLLVSGRRGPPPGRGPPRGGLGAPLVGNAELLGELRVQRLGGVQLGGLRRGRGRHGLGHRDHGHRSHGHRGHGHRGHGPGHRRRGRGGWHVPGRGLLPRSRPRDHRRDGARGHIGRRHFRLTGPRGPRPHHSSGQHPQGARPHPHPLPDRAAAGTLRPEGLFKRLPRLLQRGALLLGQRRGLIPPREIRQQHLRGLGRAHLLGLHAFGRSAAFLRGLGPSIWPRLRAQPPLLLGRQREHALKALPGLRGRRRGTGSGLWLGSRLTEQFAIQIGIQIFSERVMHLGGDNAVGLCLIGLVLRAGLPTPPHLMTAHAPPTSSLRHHLVMRWEFKLGTEKENATETFTGERGHLPVPITDGRQRPVLATEGLPSEKSPAPVQD